jgi:lipoic acid synthetase
VIAKPEWLTIRPASTEKYNDIKDSIAALGLNTVCAEAHCPNTSECWSAGTATFMILGGTCTRGCRFCAVPKSAKGDPVDPTEPGRLAKAIHELGLKYAVITSVCRDDIEDQGSGHFAACIKEIKRFNPSTAVEVLIPDFHKSVKCLKMIADAKPDVIGHNLETVERLSPKIRDLRASYALSLDVLKTVKELDSTIYTKSSIMLGLGESEPEVIRAMKDLRQSNVDFLTLGQYLSPGAHQAEVKEYITPQKFDKLRQMAQKLGFLHVASGPFVRSSYKAQEAFIESMIGRKRASA